MLKKKKKKKKNARWPPGPKTLANSFLSPIAILGNTDKQEL